MRQFKNETRTYYGMQHRADRIKNLQRWTYSEPQETGETLTHVLTEEEMIQQQHDTAAQHKHEYATDEEALLDFIAVNWCTKYNNSEK